jgi:hypothetical protein
VPNPAKQLELGKAVPIRIAPFASRVFAASVRQAMFEHTYCGVQSPPGIISLVNK